MTRPNAAGRARRTRRSRSSQPSTTTASATARRAAGVASGISGRGSVRYGTRGGPTRGGEALRRLGSPDALVGAAPAHGAPPGVPRTSLLARTVYACDELTGFI